MKEGTDPAYITSQFLLYNHSSSHYKVTLSSCQVLKAWIDSRDTKPLVHPALKKMDHSSGSSSNNSNYQEMQLAMGSFTSLAQDTVGFASVPEYMAGYKS